MLSAADCLQDRFGRCVNTTQDSWLAWMWIAAVAAVIVLWIWYRVRMRRLTAMTTTVVGPVAPAELPGEPAGARVTAVLDTKPVPKIVGWLSAIADANWSTLAPRRAPTQAEFNPRCTVVVIDRATGRALRSYDWGRDLAGATDHVASLNDRAKSQTLDVFLSNLGVAHL